LQQLGRCCAISADGGQRLPGVALNTQQSVRLKIKNSKNLGFYREAVSKY
jgi:hypothetical protein